MLALLLPAVLVQTQTPPPPKAAELISLMFKRYAEAKTVSGKITLVQQASGHSIEVDTTLALERPDLIYLHQEQSDNKNPADLVSDGIQFAYSAIPGPVSPPKLIESQHPLNGAAQHVGDMYFCLFPRLLDHSMPLDVAVARTADLKTIAAELDSFALQGTDTIRGVSVYKIVGSWKDLFSKQDACAFTLYISPQGDFERFQLQQNIAVSAKWLFDRHLPMSLNTKGVVVTSTWDADLTVDQPINHGLFTLKN